MLTVESSGAGSPAFAGEKVFKSKEQEMKNKSKRERRDEIQRGERGEEDGTQTEPSEPILSLDL